jgi:drug/metabolite transporter (DMT)-like permease
MDHLFLAVALFALGITCLAFGNTSLKVGMDQFGKQTDAGAAFFQALLHAPQLLLGVFLLTVEFIVTLILFKWGWDASVVIPVMGLSYVLTAIIGKWMLGEPVHAIRWVGIFLIVVGVAFVVQSASSAKS